MILRAVLSFHTVAYSKQRACHRPDKSFCLPSPESSWRANCADFLRMAHRYQFEPPRPRKALVATEDPQARRYLQEALSRAGFASEACSDPQAILEPDRTEGHAFVILDDHVSSHDVMRRLRKAGAAIPAILISGRTRSSEDPQVPALEHLSTPFTLRTLREAIARVCTRRP